jgi:uncharacterized protein
LTAIVLPLDSDPVPHLSLLATLLALQLGHIQVPKPVGFVNDFARVISSAAATRIEQVIADVRAKSRGEIVVVTLPDLGGRDASDVAREIARQWKVGAVGGPGDRARNAGVVIMVVPKETSRDGRGHVRVEVGTGAEGFLTDATTGAFQDEAIPYFRAQDYSSAIELITARVASRYATEFGFTLEASAPPPPRQRARRSSGGIPPQLFLVLFIVFIMLATRGRRRRGVGNFLLHVALNQALGGGRRRGGWGSGGLGGGGGGFSGFGGFGGGGGFSGGGSGRSW